MPTKALIEAKARHEKFLQKMGVHPKQLRERLNAKAARTAKLNGIRDRLEYRDVIKANQTTPRAK